MKKSDLIKESNTAEAQYLNAKAAAIPGAASLMKFYMQVEQVHARYLQCSRSVAPLVAAQASSSAIPLQENSDDN